MVELSELNSYQEASLFCSDLSEWQEGPQVLTYGAILLCRKGRAVLNVNYKDWDLYEGAVITLFPNDVVEVKKVESSASCEGDTCAGMNASTFEVEMLKYNPSLLREASLQLEQTVYSACARTDAGRIRLWLPISSRACFPSSDSISSSTTVPASRSWYSISSRPSS